MGKVLFRTVLAPCCLVLALPPGWCCSLPAFCARGEQQSKASAPAHGKDCCCCEEEPHSDRPAPAPPRQPAKPCCESQPTAPPTADTFHLDLPLLGLMVLPEPAAVRHAPDRQPVEGPPVLPCRLHLLRCVWLC